MADTDTTFRASSPTPYDTQKLESQARDRDSGVFLSDSEDLPSRPSSVVLKHTTSPSLLNRTESSASTARRLKRPAELNLSRTPASEQAKPKSELELRYDLIRNSSSQNKAHLKSPTQLLKDRLNLSPKKAKTEIERVFVPPKEVIGGCILPGPAAPGSSTGENGEVHEGGITMAVSGFSAGDIRAKTEAHNRPSWWCKFDKLVVFDGVEIASDGEKKFKTRSSKGLSIARRRGDLETVIIPLDCTHCQEMLRRSEWKYDIRVCKRGVCWNCRERCRWEDERELEGEMAEGVVEGGVEGQERKADANRERADSVLQDQGAKEEELCRKVGIDVMPLSPIETVGGIEERLEIVA